MKCLDELISISESFYEKCDSLVQKHPWAVCIAMHEYARNLYPADPYIPFSSGQSSTERVYQVTVNLIDFLNKTAVIGNYETRAYTDIIDAEVKEKTGDVYGSFWETFSYEDLTENAINILKDRWIKNGFDLKLIEGKKAIDIGCGSGRYTFALRKLGCKHVTGVDYGDRGLEVAKKIIKQSGIDNIDFEKANILDLPFENAAFDFVFCHGVLHHTEDMEKGLSEMIRVAAPGATIWLYIYGDGGIFWHARKRMPQVMKKIPQPYTMKVLNLIGMPSNRFIFADNWYVPIERHTTDKQARDILKKLGIKKIERKVHGRPTDLDYLSMNGGEEGKIMWGDGELSYFLEK